MKRAITTILLCVILGIITTVGVAWGTVRSWPEPRKSIEVLDTAAFLIRNDDQSLTLVPPDLKPPNKRRSGWINYDPESERAGWPLPTVEVWDAEYHLYSNRTVSEEEKSTMRARYADFLDAHPSARAHESFPTWVRQGRETGLVPILPGFIINTLFYAAVWFCLLFGFTRLKRTIRKTRGRCPMCKYDLRGDLAGGCSECGWGREIRNEETKKEDTKKRT